MITIPMICEAGYGNLGDDLAVSLVCEQVRKMFGYDVDIRPVTFDQARIGHMPPGLFALLGPGTLLAPNDGEWNKQLATMVDRGYRFGCVGTGVASEKDFGRTKSGMLFLGNILYNSPLLWVRGQRSLNMIDECIKMYCTNSGRPRLGVQRECVGDPISLFYEPTVKREETKKVLVNFGYTAYCQGNWEAVRQELTKLCCLLREAGYVPQAFPIWPRHDVWPLRRIAKDSQVPTPKAIQRVADLEKEVRTAAAVISFRLHCAIFSLACGVPTVAIQYQGKIPDALQTLKYTHQVDPRIDNLAEAIMRKLPAAIKDVRAIDKAYAQVTGMKGPVLEGLREVIEQELG